MDEAIGADDIEALGDLLEPIGEDDFLHGADDDMGDAEIIETVDGFFDDMVSVVKSVGSAVGSAAKAIVKSPITKAIAGGAALVFPAVGVPLAAGLTIADRAINVADGLRSPKSPAARARVTKVVAHTLKVAKLKTPQGRPQYPEAAKMVELMHVAQKLRKAQDKRLRRAPPMLKAAARRTAAKVGTLVTRDPRTHKLVIVKHARGWLAS